MLLPPSLNNGALVAHAFLLLPPAIHFLARPPLAPSDVSPVIRSYGFLLLSTHLATLLLALAPSLAEGDSVLKARIQLALAVYHIGPIWRAVERLRARDEGREMGGPAVHLTFHLAVAGGLLWGVRRAI
jgi:hypothetical protein